MIDVEHEIASTRREVSGRTLPPGEARVVTIRRVYDTTLEDLWDACTNPERIPRWFLPVSGDLQEGGRYQLEGNAGGTISQCDAPNGFDATWEYGGEVSWIELRLSTDPSGGTLFALEHIAHVDDERWAQFGPGAVGVGWDLGLLGLGLHLASGGQQVDAAEFMEWSASDAGRAFIVASSTAWGEASAASGTDAEMARECAARTTSFYTGGQA
jgi:uncharacterized protein YndB with AHSA1/START domain